MARDPGLSTDQDQDPRPTCVGVVDHLPELGEEGGHVGAGGAELGGQQDLYHGQHLDCGQWSVVTTVLDGVGDLSSCGYHEI